MRCTVINLDRQPERLAAFRQWNEGCGLKIERFAAVDSVALNDAWRPSFEASGIYTPSACALSHKHLWRAAALANEPMVIFEDDAIIRSDAPAALGGLIHTMLNMPQWDILLLGFNTDTKVQLYPGERPPGKFVATAHPSAEELMRFRDGRAAVHPFRLFSAFGLCGYVVSAQGAERLLDLCYPMGGRKISVRDRTAVGAIGIDWMLNVFYRTLDAFICFPPLVMTPNLKDGAVVSPPSESASGDASWTPTRITEPGS